MSIVALMSLVTDMDDGDVLLAIAADDEGGEYLWPNGVEPWFDGDARLALLLESVGDNPPTTDEDWLRLLGSNLGSTTLTEPQDFTTIDEAVNAAKEQLAETVKADEDTGEPPETIGEDPDPTGLLANASDSFDDISTDYPGFGEEDDAGVDPQAMLNFLMGALGPIDPSGPNGWILRAAEGTPHEGDDQQLIHFPGTMPPSEVMGDGTPKTEPEQQTGEEQ